MADAEERNLPATPRRREEARKRGQIARSPEFGPAATLFALVLALHFALPGVAGQSLLRDLQAAFRFNPHVAVFTVETASRWQETGLLWAARLILPAMLLAVALGLGVGIVQAGFQVTPGALSLKWERVNPAAGFQRLFSLRGTVELAKGLLKMGVIGGLCWTAVRDAVESGDLLRTMAMPLPSTLSTVGGLLWTLGLRVGVALLVLAAADYAYQKWEFEKGLRMTLNEVKQEMRQTEGDPHVKQRIRRLQREMSKRRMMQDVPRADVVITNPTHYAVALRYEDGAAAPKVLAKGQDLIAQRIKEIAREHGVPQVENRPLAQMLHRSVEIGQEIPGELYEAVAQVLAFVYRTYGRRPAR